MFEIIPERNQLVVSQLTDKFGESIIRHEVLTDMLCVTVEREAIREILLFLQQDNGMQFNFLTSLCGMHYPVSDQLGVVYQLHSFVHNHRIRIKTAVPLSNPNLASATSIWPAANWLERETFEFYGIIFDGHPNLQRILNVDDFAGFPLRKDFPLEDQTREDKDNSMFGR